MKTPLPSLIIAGSIETLTPLTPPIPDSCKSSVLLIDLIPRYLAHLTVRNYSPQTVESQMKQLRFFRCYCTDHGVTSLEQITRQSIFDFQAHVFHYRKKDGAPLAISTQRQWLTAVVSLMRHVTRHGLIPTNPASDLEMPRSEYRLPKAIFTAAEVEKVMRVPDVTVPFGLRDRAIMEVLYSTGIRRKELCNLNITDLDLERGLLRIEQGKGRRDRLVPIGARALLWLEKYLVHARPHLGKLIDPMALFLGSQGRRVVAGRLASHVHKLIAKANVGKTGSCHIFRHTFATLMFENGCDIRHIQFMLGHAKLQTTAIYIHLNMRDLKTAHDKYHPAKLTTADKQNTGILFAGEKKQLLFLFMTPKTLPVKRRRSTLSE